MIRTLTVMFIGAALLGACSPSEEKALSEACVIVMADGEAGEELARIKVTQKDFCTCAAKTIIAMAPAQKDVTAPALTDLAQAMRTNGGSAEAVYSTLRDAARSAEATPADEAAFKAMDDLGETLEEIVSSMGEADGACPAA